MSRLLGGWSLKLQLALAWLTLAAILCNAHGLITSLRSDGSVTMLPVTNVFVIFQVPQPVALTNSPVLPVLPPPLTTNDNYHATGMATDLAIYGDGWFILRDPRSGQIVYTRFGHFTMDSNGYLVTPAGGLRLQTLLDASGSVTGDAGLALTNLAAPVVDFSIKPDGTLLLQLSDGSEKNAGQLLLASPKASFRRVAAKFFEASGPPPARAVSQNQGLGSILLGVLEVFQDPVGMSMLPGVKPGDLQTQGVLTITGQSSDLAIQGPGFFLVRATNSGELFATRAGLFLVDADGYLITYDRKRVQGVSQNILAAPADVQLGVPWMALTNADLIPSGYFSVDTAGRITERLTAGFGQPSGQVGVYTFAAPDQLTVTHLGQYSGVCAAKPQAVSLPGGYYQPGIRGGFVELVSVPAELREIRQTFHLLQQGTIMYTGTNTQFAIEGNGYFMVRCINDGTLYARRDGNFHVDGQGYLVTLEGMRVQGQCDAGLSTLGDILVDGLGRPNWASPDATVRDFGVGLDGTLAVQLTDGTEFVRGRIMLQLFKEPFNLIPLPSGLLSNIAAALPEATMRTTSSGPAGMIKVGALELISMDNSLPPPVPSGVPRTQIFGEPNTRWMVQATTDFRQWVDVEEIVLPYSDLEWADRWAPPGPSRFYRLKPIP